jgi:diaminopimelate epimerase
VIIEFTKMEGLGNDYVYIYGDSQTIPNLKQTIINISNRHFGIGSDGVIFIEESKKADFRMRMFNADGSEGNMCGNGIRCVGKYIYDKGLSNNKLLNIETLSGIKQLELDVRNNKVEAIKVNIGKPSLKIKDLPIKFEKEEMISYPYKIDGKEYLFTAVSFGNPHLICFCEDVASLDLEKLGPLFQSIDFLKEEVNIEFVEIVDRTHLKMRVYERGSNETLACGTGACAVCVAGYLNGYSEKKVIVHLLGGDLEIEWSDQNVFMKGPAKIVFEGKIEI